MTLKALCLSSKKRVPLKQKPVLKIETTSKGIKARIIGYNNQKCTKNGKPLKMSTYIDNMPKSYISKKCSRGKVRNPISQRCNLKKNVAFNIVNYTPKQTKRLRKSHHPTVKRPSVSTSTSRPKRSTSKPKSALKPKRRTSYKPAGSMLRLS